MRACARSAWAGLGGDPGTRSTPRSHQPRRRACPALRRTHHRRERDRLVRGGRGGGRALLGTATGGAGSAPSGGRGRAQRLQDRVEQLKADSSPASRRLGETLERAISVPSVAPGRDFLYAVRTGEGAVLGRCSSTGAPAAAQALPLGVLPRIPARRALRLRASPPPPPSPVVTLPALAARPGTSRRGHDTGLDDAGRGRERLSLVDTALAALCPPGRHDPLSPALHLRRPRAFGVLRTFCEAEAAPGEQPAPSPRSAVELGNF